MRTLFISVGIFLLVMLDINVAIADPGSGIGFYGGVTSNVFAPRDGYINDTSSGMNLGMDILFRNEQESNGFYLNLVYEKLTPSGLNLVHEDAGFQSRYWFGNTFIGGHIGLNLETASFKGPFSLENVEGSQSVYLGAGFIVGWEDPDPAGGFFVTGQLDPASLSTQTGSINSLGFRLYFGYRSRGTIHM